VPISPFSGMARFLNLSTIFTIVKPVISIEYCPRCGWMLRAAYFAQELLTTFTDDVHGVMLQPSKVSGTFRVKVDDREIFDRKNFGRFPEVKELKQLVRDLVNPAKDLGHSDRKN
jgi:selenoprotein W-related protein